MIHRDFKAGDLFIPNVLLCARAMHAGLEVFRPLLAESGVKSLGKVVIGTVAGDLLLGRGGHPMRYIKAYRKREKS